MKSREELLDLQRTLLAERDPDKPCITVCAGTGCRAAGAMALVDEFARLIDEEDLHDAVTLRKTGCHGFCERGPLVVVKPRGVFYHGVQLKHVPDILRRTALKGEVLEDLLYTDPATDEKMIHEHDIPFYKKQMRLVFARNGEIDPTSITDYIAVGGYQALAKALEEMSPERIIEEIQQSGLRGRGGGGFPAGRKWESCRRAPGEPKYVVCNADEGDPGAFMDRSLLEGNPHSVIEGMIIGAYAIGSHDGYVYVRNEYPLAVETLTTALQQCRAHDLLGPDILGSGFAFDIKINRGGGAFVCGESTALMASIEGRVGEPRAKYIHTVEHGLYDKPTNLNNVETWANVPLILDRGADWFAAIGTEHSKGTKVFSLVGNINNTGLIEVPMGITLREIMFDIGGGVPGGKRFKAVQTGGPSGGTIIVDTSGSARPAEERDVHERGPMMVPDSLIDLPVDFDSLTEAGSMMGSGGMIVMDENTCMVDVARYFLNFLREESCGKCSPCREGIRNMLAILEGICEGRGREGDVELLQEMSETVVETSLCALGGTAPNPVLSTIRYFRDEYDTHIRDHKCPAGVCTALIEYSIDPEKCTGCGACAKSCPEQCITGETKQPHTLDPSHCIKCNSCADVCRFDAVVKS